MGMEHRVKGTAGNRAWRTGDFTLGGGEMGQRGAAPGVGWELPGCARWAPGAGGGHPGCCRYRAPGAAGQGEVPGTTGHRGPYAPDPGSGLRSGFGSPGLRCLDLAPRWDRGWTTCGPVLGSGSGLGSASGFAFGAGFRSASGSASGTRILCKGWRWHVRPLSPLSERPTAAPAGAQSTLTPRGAHRPRVLPAAPGGLGSPGEKPGAAAAVAGALASSEPRGGTKWQRSRWPWLLLSGASGAERAPRRS